MDQRQWLQRLKELHAVSNSHQFDLGDHVNLGIATFGRTSAFDAAAEITGTKHTRNFFTRCAAVASFYPASLRFPKLSFHTYEILARFPLSFLELFIPEIAESGRSCAQILTLAVEQYGVDPRRKRKYKIKLKVVRLPVKLYHALTLRASSPDKTHMLVWKILEDYLGAEPVGAQQDPVGACPTDGNDVESAQPCQKTGAEAESPKRRFKGLAPKRKCTCRIKLVWTACKGLGANSNIRGRSFADRAAAEAAQRQYENCHGYAPFISYCEKCHAFHLYHFEPVASQDSVKAARHARC